MPLFTSLTALSQTPGANPPDGGSDAPSTIDDNLRLLGSFAALLRDAAHVYVASVAGTNTITGNIATNPTSYTVGQVYRFVAAGANTGAVTLNFNSLGAKNLLKVGNVALTGGELQGTCVYEAVYDGVSFQLVGMYGFKNSLGTAGYQYLPSGLILQWGSTSGVTDSFGVLNAVYSMAFPTSVFMVLPSNGDGLTVPGGIATYQSGSTSNVNFKIFTGTTPWASSAARVNWIALGK